MVVWAHTENGRKQNLKKIGEPHFKTNIHLLTLTQSRDSYIKQHKKNSPRKPSPHPTRHSGKTLKLHGKTTK
jgi:hypothetical protein